jgi:hypothetical protein
MSSSSSGGKLMPGAWSSPKNLAADMVSSLVSRESERDGGASLWKMAMVPHAFWIYRSWDDQIGLMQASESSSAVINVFREQSRTRSDCRKAFHMRLQLGQGQTFSFARQPAATPAK